MEKYHSKNGKSNSLRFERDFVRIASTSYFALLHNGVIVGARRARVPIRRTEHSAMDWERVIRRSQIAAQAISGWRYIEQV